MTVWLGGKAWLGAALMLLALAFAVPAYAASPACRSLEAQLASAGKGSGNSAEARKWRNAADRQRNELAKARARAARAGCGGSFFSIGGECGAINGAISKMKGNLASLERKAASLSGGGRSRESILAALDARGCREVKEIKAIPGRLVEKQRGLFEMLFESDSERTKRELAARRAAVRRLGDGLGNLNSVGSGGGTYTTLCVRTCDGSYFPISFSTTREHFEKDEEACQAQCPGTEAALYVHEVPEQEAEDMVSVKGKPYSALPNAFAYRQAGFKRPEGCFCSAQAGVSGATAQGSVPSRAWPRPAGRPDPLEDPESAANRKGDLNAEVLARLLGEGTLSASTPVRVVGPVFLPDPKAAIDLQAQVPTSVQ
ncbi:MAG: DUF2865 domain-containing protein [Rhizobiaceae bacterium]